MPRASVVVVGGGAPAQGQRGLWGSLKWGQAEGLEGSGGEHGPPGRVQGAAPPTPGAAEAAEQDLVWVLHPSSPLSDPGPTALVLPPQPLPGPRRVGWAGVQADVGLSLPREGLAWALGVRVEAAWMWELPCSPAPAPQRPPSLFPGLQGFRDTLRPQSWPPADRAQVACAGVCTHALWVWQVARGCSAGPDGGGLRGAGRWRHSVAAGASPRVQEWRVGGGDAAGHAFLPVCGRHMVACGKSGVVGTTGVGTGPVCHGWAWGDPLSERSRPEALGHSSSWGRSPPRTGARRACGPQPCSQPACLLHGCPAQG